MKKSRGFTLVEIVIVVAILAILAMVMILGNVLNQVQKARDARRKQELATIQRLLEDYYNDNNRYLPVDQTSVDGLGCITNSKRFSPYLPKLPCDPQYFNRTYFYVSDDNSYQKYRIYAQMENGKDSDVLNNPCGGGCAIGSRLFNYVVTSPNVNIAAQITPPPGYIGPSGVPPGPTATTAPTPPGGGPTSTPVPPTSTPGPSPTGFITVTPGGPTPTPGTGGYCGNNISGWCSNCGGIGINCQSGQRCCQNPAWGCYGPPLPVVCP